MKIMHKKEKNILSEKYNPKLNNDAIDIDVRYWETDKYSFSD